MPLSPLPSPQDRLRLIDPAVAQTDEIVAPGDPLYVRVAEAARRGRIPGWKPVDFLRGDRLYTRRELQALLPAEEDAARVGGLLVLGNQPRGLLHGPGWLVQATKAGVTAAEVNARWRGWDFSVGRRPVRWGPGWSGGMLFSDSAPPLDQVRVARQWGRFRFEQFYGQYFEPEDTTGPPDTTSGTRRHLAGRRLTITPSRKWEITAGEAIKAMRLPDPAFAAVLPWYVYSHDWSSLGTGRWLGLPRSTFYTNSYWINYMAHLSAVYRPDSRSRLYADYILDDIKAPRFLGGSAITPQRTGLLLGAAGRSGALGWCAEVVDINRTTYRSEVISNWWNRGDAPLGHPAGPNSLLMFLRTDLRVNDRLSLALEAARQRRRDTTRPGSPDLNRVALHVATTLSPQSFATARVERDGARLTFGWIP